MSEVNIVSLVRNLGELNDKNLTMNEHIQNVVKVCNYHLRNIAFVRKYLNMDTLEILIHNYIITRLDYCNSVYFELPNNILRKLQNVQNAHI